MEPGFDTVPSPRRALLVVAGLALALGILAAAGCGSVGFSDSGDRANGKTLFTKGVSGAPSCASCHTLADAGSTGQIGPNLDYAFLQSRRDGLGQSTIQQVVLDQIYYPTEVTGTGAPGMPDVDQLLPECAPGETEGCVERQEEAAQDIAAYVASVAGIGIPEDGGEPPPAPVPQPQPQPQPEPQPEPGGEGAGKQVYAEAGCGSCHTLADAGSGGQVGPNLDESQPDQALVTERVTNGRGAMPPFRDQLSEQQIADVARYVSQVAGQ